ncbi:uncharacterized protein LOC108835981 [Raphanus sativus]|uniref:Uncharacterized protein LOC108835981 n=1 Tax=Raphanus sativus TaxID=3726 RepID=A0A6J0LWV3_RAPSA|nr:uncharacterized protein LOC108835981 [Raphanus sativus]XP_018464696.2 uncharacterized protein LOC108835981 [Raphanus sativus]
MSGTSASARSDKSGKNSKGLPLAAVKDEFASSSKRKNTCTKIEYEILKENHETLKIDYESLQKRFKLAEETYEVMKKLLLQSKAERREDGVRERNDKEMESEGKGKIDELRKREEELLLAIRKGKEDKAKLEDKFVALAERFCVVEADCEYLKSLYDAEVAASEIEETNKLKNNVKNDATVISDHNDPVGTRSQDDQCKNQEIFTPRAVTNDSPPSSASPSSSSSSSDGYDVVIKLPANWPDWALPKGPGDDSSKS